MKIRVLYVGKIRECYSKVGVEEFLKRLRSRRVELLEIADSNVPKEGEDILKKISDGDLVVALLESGEQLTSLEFADFIRKAEKNICFVLGGPEGLSEEVLKRANRKLSLSRMTFTHEMARLILLEQIYRAFMIIEDKPYHR
jgi:23S rRNA (pseudouridine1915-N3)-methyltransferase